MSNIQKFANPVRVGNFSADPVDVSAGAIYWNTGSQELFVADGSAYHQLAISSNVFSTSLFRLSDGTDPTKLLAFDDSAITTGTTRTIIMPNANVDLGNLTNSNISPSAAIVYSKLNLSNSIVNADINSAAAIAYSKLNLSASIVNADIASGAAIAYSKLNLSASVKASDQNSQAATSTQALFANGSGGAAYRSIVSGDLPSLSAIYVTQSEVGQPSGVASLDGGGKVPLSQLPATLMEFQGNWDPTSNTPTLVDGTGVTGYTYWVSAAFAGPVSGLTDPSMVNFQIGDLVIYNGTKWVLVTPAAGVTSVNGSQGAVTVNAINQLTGDVTAGPASGSQSKAATVAKIQGTTVSGTTGSGNVVFSAAPTLTGLLSGGSASFSSTIAASNFSGSSSGTNTGDQTITLTGDITGSGTGSFATTLATVNGNVGSFGSSTSIPSFTVNAKGLITAASGNAVVAPAGTLSGTTLNSTVVNSSLTSVGTLTSLTVAGTISASNFSGSSSGTNTGDISLAAIGSSPNANAATLSGQVLNLEPANASFGGVVTTGTQTFAGDKTFNGNIIDGANLSVASLFNRGDGGTTNVVQEQYKDALSLTQSTTAVLAALTYDSRNFKGVSIEYTISNGSNRRKGRLELANNNASGSDSTVISLTDQSTETADVLVSWSAAMNGHNVELSYTTGAGTFNMNADIKRFRS